MERKLEEIFREVFRLLPTDDVTRVRQVNHPAWDSLAHVTLIGAIESEFNIAIDVADSIELTSFEAAALYISERVA
jgi:acyl carrier protein